MAIDAMVFNSASQVVTHWQSAGSDFTITMMQVFLDVFETNRAQLLFLGIVLGLRLRLSLWFLLFLRLSLFVLLTLLPLCINLSL